MALPAILMGLGAAGSLASLFGGGGKNDIDISGILSQLPTSQLPDVAKSLGLYNQLMGRGEGVLSQGVYPTEEMAALQPFLDSSLAKLRAQANTVKAQGIGEAEKRGLTMSDIGLNKAMGADIQYGIAEQDILANLLQQALGLRSSRQNQNLSWINQLMSNAMGLAGARDTADINRGNQIAELVSAQLMANNNQPDIWSKVGQLSGNLMGLGLGLNNPMGLNPNNYSSASMFSTPLNLLRR